MADAPLIVTAVMRGSAFEHLDGLRRAHFPPARNFLPAHLTLFHHLPPAREAELLAALAEAARRAPPDAWLGAPKSLGRGVAFSIDSPALAELRARLAALFEGALTPQDRQPWRGHVTVQNKVEPEVARALLAELSAGFTPRPLELSGLAAWHYRGGPWAPIASFPFGETPAPATRTPAP